LAASNRLRTRYDIGTKQVLLQISDVRPDDVGEYRVIATNPAGEDSTSCKLSVVPDRRGVDSQPSVGPDRFLNLKPIPATTRPEDETAEVMRPPRVVVPLNDCDLEEQMPVIFIATIDPGAPMATVRSYVCLRRCDVFVVVFSLFSSLPGRRMVNRFSRAIDSRPSMILLVGRLHYRFLLRDRMIKEHIQFEQ
jgi:hypothetical protein